MSVLREAGGCSRMRYVVWRYWFGEFMAAESGVARLRFDRLLRWEAEGGDIGGVYGLVGGFKGSPHTYTAVPILCILASTETLH
jgi:hypothetical protein